MAIEDVYESLSDELKERVRACETPDEIMELAEAEGIELTLDQVDAVAGGGVWGSDCPNYYS